MVVYSFSLTSITLSSESRLQYGNLRKGEESSSPCNDNSSKDVVPMKFCGARHISKSFDRSLIFENEVASLSSLTFLCLSVLMNFSFFCIVMSIATWLSKVVARITLYPAVLSESYDKIGFLKGNSFIDPAILSGKIVINQSQTILELEDIFRNHFIITV